MRFLTGLVLTAGICLGMAGESRAQFGLSIGSPYYGTSVYAGAPAYGVYGGPAYYGPGYAGVPGSFAYSSGYTGLAPAGSFGYVNRPYYGGYGYGNGGYVVRNGFRPFGGGRRYYR